MTRPDSSFEIIGQKLSKPLIANLKYRLKIYACQSKIYKSSTSKNIKEIIDFTQPTCILISGLNDEEGELFILSKSDPVINYEWKEYTIDFI